MVEICGTSCSREVGQHGQCRPGWVYTLAPKCGVDISMVVQKEWSILTCAVKGGTYCPLLVFCHSHKC